MKKFYFIGLMALGITAGAQTSVPKATAQRAMAPVRKTAVDYQMPSPVVLPNPSRKSTPLGKAQMGGMINQKIGGTLFVTQSAGAINRRTIAYADGKVSATWTTSSDNGTNKFLTRGSGYNSFDGNTWVSPNTSSPRVEGSSFRTGYPGMVNTGTKEMIIAHRVDTAGNASGMALSTNASTGSTTWSTISRFAPPAQTPSALWPHSAVSGDYVIIVESFQDSTPNQPKWVYKNGVQSPLVYSRYKISTNTWTEEEITLPGYDTSVFNDGTSDVYSIDANGNNVAIVVGYYFTNLVMWKSADNGANWTRTIVNQFPVPHYKFDHDTLLPRVQVPTGSVHVLVDNNGKAHVFTGMCMIQDSILLDGYYTYYHSAIVGGVNDGILYWNEYHPDSSMRVIASAIPLGGDSSILAGSYTNADRTYGNANSMSPSAGIDADGTMYLTYSALTPSDQTQEGSTSANYRDILITYSSDKGATWATPQNATQYLGSNVEQIYPNTARFVNDRVHLTYLSKSFPGLNIAASNTEVFDINYLSIPVAEIKSNSVGIAKVNDNLFGIEQNYPNPFHGLTTIDVNFKHSANATLTIVDVMGKTVYAEAFAKVPAGKSSISVNTGNIPAGVYFYTIESEGSKVTRRMLVD